MGLRCWRDRAACPRWPEPARRGPGHGGARDRGLRRGTLPGIGRAVPRDGATECANAPYVLPRAARSHLWAGDAAAARRTSMPSRPRACTVRVARVAMTSAPASRHSTGEPPRHVLSVRRRAPGLAGPGSALGRGAHLHGRSCCWVVKSPRHAAPGRQQGLLAELGARAFLKRLDQAITASAAPGRWLSHRWTESGVTRSGCPVLSARTGPPPRPRRAVGRRGPSAPYLRQWMTRGSTPGSTARASMSATRAVPCVPAPRRVRSRTSPGGTAPPPASTGTGIRNAA